MRVDVFADYYQIAVFSSEAQLSGIADAWTDEAVSRHLATAPGVLGLGTLRAMTVPVEILLVAAEPQLDDAADFIVDADIAVDGPLTVSGVSSSRVEDATIELKPGLWRARYTITGKDSVSADETNGNDSYQLTLWPTAAAAAVVVHR